MSLDNHPKPQALVPGNKLRVAIEDLAFGGEGVARFEEFVIFVPFVLPGEMVEIEVLEVKKRFARARLLDVVTSAPGRVPAPCRYFGVCGGCQYQHIDYPIQLELKHKQITDLFQRVGKFQPAIIDPVVPCPNPYDYRNRIMVRSQWDKFKQGLNIGFLRQDSRLVIDIEECIIAEPAINEQLQHVRTNPPPRGGFKVVLRIPPEGWEVPGDSFFQNNFRLLPKLVGTARNAILASGARYLIDVYCGVGFFALELADLVETYVGVEVDRPAIKAARENALHRNRTNGEFVSGRAEGLLSSLLKRFPARQTAVVLDPPRTGCPPESMELLREIQPAQILYVSCHPATLARDASLLCRENVYQLQRVTPLDMFPQTQHVECVADFRLSAFQN